jgi:diaminohydroxyphosphoribosylaminopyrimidine deaminase/5-amino-6-(5-phosphoribosylamino)uracil reductase
MKEYDKQNKLDIYYMKRALRLAKKGEGTVSPNPLVGAVIVKNNHIIGEGYHQKYGEAHAEINAINSAAQSVKDATLYSTLEPCCHTGKQTPPCVDRIIKEGIKRVVAGGMDPNPKVKGRGLSLLEKAGIEVTKDILAQENQDLNKFYFKYVKRQLPYITLKIAQTIDGYISDQKNHQLWLTGKRAKRLVHRWRSAYDSVLIGANTLRADNPLLTARYGKGRDPLRIIIAGLADIDPDLKIFCQKQNHKTWLITAKRNHSKLLKILGDKGCEIIDLPADSDHLIPLLSVLEYLAKQKITSVLVEGGQQIFSQFIQSGLWDELKLFIAPKILGKGIKVFTPDTEQKVSSFHLHDTTKIGEDVLLTYLPGDPDKYR